MEHAELINKWANDPGLNYYDDDRPEPSEPIPLEKTRTALRRMIDADGEGIIRFAIHRLDNGMCIGICMIALIDRHNRRCNLGISIGERDQWGQGFGREAVMAMVNHCFRDMNMNRIGAEVYAYNERSLRLFEGLGFLREGLIRQAVWKRGAFADSVILGLLRSDWLAEGQRE
jgi:RimJ/RimL family protein N-acetyltransferase